MQFRVERRHPEPSRALGNPFEASKHAESSLNFKIYLTPWEVPETAALPWQRTLYKKQEEPGFWEPDQEMIENVQSWLGTQASFDIYF
jgi:hypothetical protein